MLEERKFMSCSKKGYEVKEFKIKQQRLQIKKQGTEIKEDERREEEQNLKVEALEKGLIEEKLWHDIYETWEMYRPMWKKWAYKMAMVDYSKEDWEQHSLLICKRAVETYQSSYGIQFSAYYRMLLYREGARIRQKTHLHATKEGEAILQEQKDVSVDVETTCVEMSESNKVMQLIAMLEERDQYIIKAYYFQNCPIARIAKACDMSYKQVENRKAALLKRLRQKWGTR